MVYEKASILFSRNPRLLTKLGCLLIDEAFMLGELTRGASLEVALAKALHKRHTDDASEDVPRSESLRVIALSTEGEATNDLASLFFSRDLDTDDENEPLVYRDSERPVVVEHCLLLSKLPSSEHKDFTVFPFLKFSGGESRALDTAALEEIERTLHPLAEQLAESRNSFTRSSVVEHRDRLIRFALSRLEAHPTGYRLLIFAASKAEVETLAGGVFNHRASLQNDRAREERIAALIKAVDAGEDRQLGRIISKYASRGVFFHHSDIERPIRSEIERLAASSDLALPSEVLVSTTTLAYGVNLAISEVVVVGIQFFLQSRKGLVRKENLSLANYHNMVGRAGRLGMASTGNPRAYLSVPLDVLRPFGLIKGYYAEQQGLRSKLFVRDDRQPAKQSESSHPLAKALATAYPDHRQASEYDLSSYTHPFVQAVLDTLRHLNYVASNSALVTRPVQFQGNPSGNDIANFLLHTLFFAQNKGRQRMLERFVKSIREVLEACSLPPLQQVHKTSKGVFEIREAGEAVIDTSTEISTVRTLASATIVVRRAWASVFNTRPFPTELFVLPLLMQEEVYRVTVDSTPEGRSGGKRRYWTSEIEEANRKTVAKMFEDALREACGVDNDARKLGTALRGAIAEFDTVRLIATPYSGEGGGADALCRLFCSMIAWINGKSLTKSRRFAERLTPDKQRQPVKLDGVRMSFRQLSEKLRYKAIFLAKLLAAGATGLEVGLEQQRLVFLLAERLRLGARTEAIPLFYPRASNLSRGEAHGLVDEGWTAERILLQSRQEAASMPLDPTKQVELQQDLESLSINHVSELAAEITLGGGGTVREEAVEEFWKTMGGTASSLFSDSIQAYRSTRPTRHQFSSMMLDHFDLERWLPQDEISQRFGLRGGFVVERRLSAETEAVDRIWSGRTAEQNGAVRWYFERPTDDVDEPGAAKQVSYRVVEAVDIYGVDMRRDWSVSRRVGEWEPVAEFLGARSNDLVAVVPVPWVPPISALERQAQRTLDALWEEGRGFFFITPAAFGVLASFTVRRLVGAGVVQSLLAIPQSRGWRRPLTVADVRETLVEGALDPVPRSIREALLAYMETVDAT